MLDNAERSGSFTIAGSSWFNLWVGLNDSSRRNLRQPVVGREFRIFEASAATFEERNQILREKIVRRVEERGAWTIALGQLSRQYFRLFDADSYRELVAAMTDRKLDPYTAVRRVLDRLEVR